MLLPKIEISVKYKGAKKTELQQVRSSKDIYCLLKKMYNSNTIEWFEELILICLNNQNKVIGYYKVSSGGTGGTVCDPKIIFTVALNCIGTTQIIISHNHPSGGLTPSNQDKLITNKIKDAGKMLEIHLLDHIIYTEDEYFSFLDNGIL